MPVRSLQLNNLWLRNLANAVLFQWGWFACLWGGDVVALSITPLLLMAHGLLINPPKHEWAFIAVVGCLGFLADSLFSMLGILQFDDASLGMIPAWLLCLWLLFASTLMHSLGWLRHRLLLAGLLGAIAGPASYFAGTKLAPVVLQSPTSYSLMVLSVFWGILLPGLYLLARNMRC